ncbi:MAG: hypothetical protein QW057_00495 [Candidatus Bathyarchaeia archaeon]
MDGKCVRILMVLLKDEERAAWTVERLSVQSKLSSRAVRSHLKHLVDEGLVKERQTEWGALYRLSLPEGAL